MFQKNSTDITQREIILSEKVYKIRIFPKRISLTMPKQESFHDELMDLMDELYPDDFFTTIFEYQRSLLNEGDDALKAFLSLIHSKNSFPRLSDNMDEDATEPSVLQQILHLSSKIKEAKGNGATIRAPPMKITSQTAVAAPVPTSVATYAQSASASSVAPKGEDTRIKSPRKRDQYNARYVVIDNVGQDVVIEDNGVYKFPKRHENENERTFYRGEHVQYRQHPLATQYHGFLLGPTKGDFSCITIMDEISGELLSDIWPCNVELSDQKERVDQGLLPKRPSEIMKFAQTCKASQQRFEDEGIFHDCSQELCALPVRDNFLGGENYRFVS